MNTGVLLIVLGSIIFVLLALSVARDMVRNRRVTHGQRRSPGGGSA